MAVEKITPKRVIHLSSPYMRGEDVKAVQRRTGAVADGEYGPVSGSAVARWKFYVGYPESEINNGIGIWGQKVLFQQEPIPAAYRARAKQRIAEGKKLVDVAAKACDLMQAWAKAGYKESPANSNVVPALVALSRKNGVKLGPGMGFPWCEWSANLAALLVGGASAKAGLIDQKWNAAYTVAAVDAAREGKFNSRLVSVADAPKGAKVYFDFDGSGGDPVTHVGRLIRHDGPYVVTVEGNTSVSGSQDNGGAVLVRRRPLSQVRFAVLDS